MAANFSSTGSDTFPAGMVIQTVFKMNEAQSQNQVGDGNTYTSDEMILAITTSKLNSVLDVEMVSYGTHSQAGTFGDAWFQRAVTGGATNQLEEDKQVNSHYNRGEGGTNNYEPLVMRYRDTTGYAASTTITWACRYKRHSGSNSYYFVHSGFAVFCKITEYSV